ncbi:seminase-like [Scaptodrosophila lebanonensis]|uniref:trypsin n=1 Tax=Drosophila lebanonensis TaxID=7225 RepID=A0A6J2TI36_DROLE|nr:seminase-like [Scaptodrosophila lebanonensis]
MADLGLRLVLVLLLMQLTRLNGRIYPDRISTDTKKETRQWGGMMANTGTNLGGWLLRITSGFGNFACGAAYYSPLIMLTSANCIQPIRYSLEAAIVDVTAMCEREDTYAVIDTFYSPPTFRVRQTEMDIAVVTLQEPLGGRLTEIIKLCSTPIKEGMSVDAVGWGFLGLNYWPRLQFANTSSVVVGNLDSCREQYKDIRNITDSSFCVTLPADKNDCIHDNGCPLIKENELCGIVSYGGSCLNTTYPGIYTDINAVSDYIERIENDVVAGVLSRRRRRRRRSIHQKKMYHQILKYAKQNTHNQCKCVERSAHLLYII